MATETLAWNILAQDAGASRVFNTVAAAMAGASKASATLAGALKAEEAAAGAAAKSNLTLAQASRVLEEAQAKMAATAAAANAAMRADGASAADTAAKLSAAAAEYKALIATMTAATLASRLDTAAMKEQADTAAATAAKLASIKVVTGGAGLGTTISLFGGLGVAGIMKTVAAWHLLTDAIIETAAVVIPATVATVAFAAAAAPAVQNVIRQFQNLNTVSGALGKNIYPLTGGFDKLAAAAQPHVYQILGDALVVLQSRSGTLAKLVSGAGQAFDQLAARATSALVSSGASVFLKNAVSDLSQIGTVVGNIFGIVGNLLKAMPGYAERLLGLLQSVTHGLETFTASPIVQGVAKVGLAFHGAALYMGLAGTAIGKVVQSALVPLGAGLARAGGFLSRFGGFAEKAGTYLVGFGVQAERAASLPWGWIAAAAIGIGILVDKMVTAKDAMQQWVAAQQAILDKTPAVRGYTLALQDQAAIAGKLKVAYQGLSPAAARAREETIGAGMAGAGAMAAARQQANDLGALKDAYRTVGTQVEAYRGNMKALAGQFGGTAHAQFLMAQAGLTWNQVATKNKSQLASDILQMQAADSAFKAMGLGTGRAAAAMNALNISEGTGNTRMAGYLAQMQKITQAQDTITTVVAGSEQAFVSLVQGLDQIRKDASAGGASLAGLGKNSLTLRNDFWNTVIPGMQKMIDTLNMQDISTGNLTKAIATQAKQVLGFTKNNEAARAMLVSLINNALGPGTVGLKNLDTWVRQNSTTMQGFSKIVDAATIKAGTLAGTLKNMLNVQFHDALLQASGADSALKKYTGDLVNNQGTTAKGHADRQALITDLEKAGFSAKQAAAYVNSLSKAEGGLHSELINIIMHGTGSYMIKTGIPIGGGNRIKSAAGGHVRGPGTGTSDSVPALLSAGEYVVKAASVSKYGTKMMDSINAGRYAAGGAVTGNLTPGYITGMYHSFTQSMAGTMVSDMRAAIRAAAASAAAAATRHAGIPAGSYTPAGGVAALAQRMFPWPMSLWPDFNAVEMREAGYSLTAQNPSSGAYGLAQFINGPSEYYQYGGNPYTAAGQLIAMFNYIRQRYGTPAGAWAHEVNYGWYDKGGALKPGWNLAFNGTGRPEPVGAAAGTTVINLSVQVGHGTNPRQAAKEIVDLLNRGATGGIKLRKSILATSG